MALIRLLELIWPDRRRSPRYCHTGRCIRLAGHPGLHVDDAGRAWS